MKQFRTDNTEGYSQKQLDSLNEEWEEKASDLGVEEFTEEYDFAAKCFSDEISRR